MLDLRDIHSLSEFQRNTREFLEHMRHNSGPVVLTVKGKAEVVVQDARSYQEVITRLERAEAIAAIRTGMSDFEKGNAQEANDAFDELRRKHDIPR